MYNMKRNITEEFINKLELLKKLGVNINKLTERDTIETLAKKSEVDKEKLEKVGLNPKNRIGVSRATIVHAYRGNGHARKPTEKQIEKLLKLGIRLEKQERNVAEEFISKLEKLQKLKIDIKKLTLSDTIETLAKKSEINIEKIKKIGLNPKEKIGKVKDNLSQAWQGTGTYKKPTEKDVKRLLELGVSLEKKKTNGKEIAKASIVAIKHMDMVDNENKVLAQIVQKRRAREI